MARFEKGSKEAKEWGRLMREKRNQKNGEGFLDTLKNIGKKMGDPFKKTIGVNPFTVGYDAGYALGNKIKGNGLTKKKNQK